jgi:hypothetical protein
MRRRGTPGMRSISLRPASADDAGEVPRFLPADRVVMHHVQRVAGLRDMDARQRPEGAAGEV